MINASIVINFRDSTFKNYILFLHLTTMTFFRNGNDDDVLLLVKVLTVVVSVSANHGIDEEVEIGQRAE
jgi:hypothetical protein